MAGVAEPLVVSVAEPEATGEEYQTAEAPVLPVFLVIKAKSKLLIIPSLFKSARSFQLADVGFAP